MNRTFVASLLAGSALAASAVISAPAATAVTLAESSVQVQPAIAAISASAPAPRIVKDSVVVKNTSPYRRGTASHNKWWAKRYMKLKYGWGKQQYEAVKFIFEHESGWQQSAVNSSSGAYGIPQALPASKLAAFGSDWRTNPQTQIKWGLSYMKSRYGSPAKAYQFWTANHWY